MKKRTIDLFTVAGALAVLLGTALIRSTNNSRVVVKADTIDHYMARFYNQDKHSMPSSRANYAVPKFDNTSDLTWTMSYGSYRNKDSEATKFSSLQLGGGYYTTSDANTIKMLERSISNASYSGTVFGDIYEDLGTNFETYCSAMVSDQYVSNIQDIAFYWNSVTEIYSEPEFAHSNVRIVYLLDGEDHWRLLLRDDGEGGASYTHYRLNIGSGTGIRNSWNAYAAFAGNPLGGEIDGEGDFATNLQGKDARIGIVISTNNYHVNYYYYISAITINRVASIKALMDYLDSKSWTCAATSENYNMYEQLMEIGAYKMLQSQANELNVAHSFVNSTETTYFGLFSYLCNRVFISLPVTPSSSNIIMESINTNYGILITSIISLSCLAVSSGSYLYFKKKKHN